MTTSITLASTASRAYSETLFAFPEALGGNTILVFYPKDNTSGCTKELEDFRDAFADFEAKGYAIFGVSRDSINAHHKFSDKLGLPFSLLSDKDEALCTYFDVLKQKSMYGRQYMGIERSTFILDKNASIIKEWRNVKVPNHVNEVRDFISKA